MSKTDAEWRAALTPLQYHVLREKGTERAFTGEYWEMFKPGTYLCGGCRTPLFRSEQKYDHGCGWPAFTQAVDDGKIVEHRDVTFGMRPSPHRGYAGPSVFIRPGSRRPARRSQTRC